MSEPDESVADSSRINRRQLLVGAVGMVALSACAKTNDTDANSAEQIGSVAGGDLGRTTTPGPRDETAPGEATPDETVPDEATPDETAANPRLLAESRSTEEPFFGLTVADFPATEPGPDIATRLHVGYDPGSDFGGLVSALAAHPNASMIEALVIGAYVNDSLDTPSTAIDVLVATAKSFPSLKALFFGDVSTEVSEISWIECGDQAALANAFPELETLLIRGAGNGSMTGLSLKKLRTLIIETGGLKPVVVRNVLAADLPSLEHLELWLGTSGYGGEATVSDLAPLLERKVLKGLKYVGLRNSEIADALAVAIARSALISSITELDLSLGTMSDEGFGALAGMDPSPNLTRLNVSHHYASEAAVGALSVSMGQRNVVLDVTDPQTGAADERYVTISE